MNFALIENNIVTNIIIADNVGSISVAGEWVECPDDLVMGDNYMNYLRGKAYIAESDPIYFKWKRGEATEQEWLDKVAEIKTRYPE
jgi:hypothetical protein